MSFFEKKWFSMVYGRGKREDGDGTVFDFFIGKMDQEMAVSWSKTEVMGQFYVFFKQL